MERILLGLGIFALGGMWLDLGIPYWIFWHLLALIIFFVMKFTPYRLCYRSFIP